MLLYVTVLVLLLISSLWRNWKDWYLLCFFSVWITPKAIKYWKLSLFYFSAPANGINPSASWIKSNSCLPILGQRQAQGRVQPPSAVRNTVHGWAAVFAQKGPSIGFASPWDLGRIYVSDKHILLPFPQQFLNRLCFFLPQGSKEADYSNAFSGKEVFLTAMALDQPSYPSALCCGLISGAQPLVQKGRFVRHHWAHCLLLGCSHWAYWPTARGTDAAQPHTRTSSWR